MFHGFTLGAVETEFGVAPERGYAPKIKRAIRWATACGGRVRPSDIGATYDTHEADITCIVYRTNMADIETFAGTYQGQQVQYQSPPGVYPFGPHIDSVTAPVLVRVMDVTPAGKVARMAPYWTAHVRMRLDQAYTPTTGTLPDLFAHKYATPHTKYPQWVQATADGRALGVDRVGGTYACTVSADALSPSEASAAVNWAMWVRGNTFTYTPPPGLSPFGPAMGSPHTVFLLNFTVQKYKPTKWSMTFELMVA